MAQLIEILPLRVASLQCAPAPQPTAPVAIPGSVGGPAAASSAGGTAADAGSSALPSAFASSGRFASTAAAAAASAPDAASGVPMLASHLSQSAHMSAHTSGSGISVSLCGLKLPESLAGGFTQAQTKVRECLDTHTHTHTQRCYAGRCVRRCVLCRAMCAMQGDVCRSLAGEDTRSRCLCMCACMCLLQALCAVLGYALLLMDLAAAYMGAPLLHEGAFQVRPHTYACLDLHPRRMHTGAFQDCHYCWRSLCY